MLVSVQVYVDIGRRLEIARHRPNAATNCHRLEREFHELQEREHPWDRELATMAFVHGCKLLPLPGDTA